ncbi:alpha-1,2-fucosyltransferase [Rhodoferax mekongensis]|uniref:Alpha-1,2-fucosyltransferase n=1 Tax=Rhodoferax mekongensis TaxID=3068341 RepID=A0ABZ0B444_9BURK|nr:alpha-1,2-fucosyltransferase [Rhodoferax sp. TBRC 17307]WNO05824.1 alpha-1,2-fucosyltransferase [Rhodoferax sp. TBRC 17307]
MGTKVIPRIFGGLGNQLFCYAAARRLALATASELVIDDVSGFANDSLYQRHSQLEHFHIPCRKALASERMEPFSRIRRYLKRKINAQKRFELRTYIQQVGMDFDSRLLDVQPRGNLYLEGYWQGEAYFKDIEPVLRADLRIKPPSDAKNLDVALRVRTCTAIAVHVRFFDTPGIEGGTNAPGDYYARAIAKMEELVPQAHYFLFSDQPESARERIPLPDDRVTCVSHNQGDAYAYADLWLMTQCQHFIIANSTFSWWGAWLSASPGKHVIAPGYKKLEGKAWWGFDGLLPAEWIKL